MNSSYTEIKKSLLLARFRKDYDVFISLCEDDANFLDSVIHDLIDARDRLQFVSARLIQLLSDSNPELLNKYDSKIIRLIGDTSLHSSVRRTALRVFMKIELKKDVHATLINECLERLFDRSDAIACRVFAIHVLLRLAKIYPDLAREVRPYLLENMPLESVGFRAASKNYLLKTQKL